MLKRIIKKLLGSSTKEVITLSNNDVILDFGNNLIKVCSSNKKISFLSKIRKASESETVMQRNSIKFNNGDNYIIGDNKAQLTKANRKIDREHAKELILYAISNLDINHEANFKAIEGITTIDLYMLLPLPQLNTEPLFRELLEGQEFNIKVNNVNRSYRINLIQCVAEGKMCINNVDHKTMRTDILIFDIGGRTNDIFWFDKELNEVGKCSYPKGIQNITAKYMNVVQANSLIHMEKRLNKGNFTKEELKHMEGVEIAFFDEIIKYVKDNIMCDLLEEDTTILFVGGGSLALRNAIKNYFNNTKYDIRFLKDAESVFANASGYQKYISENKVHIEEYYSNIKKCKIEKLQSEEVEEVKIIESEEVEEMGKMTIENQRECKYKKLFPYGIIEGGKIDNEVSERENNRIDTISAYEIYSINNVKKLSKKERMSKCQKLYAEGKNIKEIMESLQVKSINTVKGYLKEMQLI